MAGNLRVAHLRSPRRLQNLLLGLCVLCYAAPLLRIAVVAAQTLVRRTDQGGGDLGLVLVNARVARIIGLTCGQTLASVVVCLGIGIPLGWALGRRTVHGSSVLGALLLAPFALPTVTVALAMFAIVGSPPDSLSGRFLLIVGAHALFNVGLVVRTVALAVEALPVQVEEAAASLGASAKSRWLHLRLPLLSPAIASSALLVALLSLTSFGAVVLLGGHGMTTLEVEVWVLATRQFDLGAAALLAVGQFFLVVLLLLAFERTVRWSQQWSGLGIELRPLQSSTTKARVYPTRAGLTSLASWATALTLVGVPLGALVMRSGFDNGQWTWSRYVDLFGNKVVPLRGVDFVEVLWRSVGNAGVATVVATLIAVPVAIASRNQRVTRPVNRATSLSLGVPATLMGLGYLVLASGPPVDLRSSRWLLPVVQGILAAPICVRILAPPVSQIGRGVIEAARTLNSSGIDQAVRVWLPPLLRPLAFSAGCAFAFSIGEFGASSFLARSGDPTLTQLVARILSRPSVVSLSQACALSLLIGTLAVGAIVLPSGGVGLLRVGGRRA